MLALSSSAHPFTSHSPCEISQVNEDQQKENEIALREAILHKNLEEAIRLIVLGVKVDFANNEDVTLLGMAIENDRPDIVELLIEKGARVDAVDKHGFTPLMLAILFHNHAMVELLIIKCGADVNLGDDLHIPLLYTIHLNRSDTVQLLLNNRANIDIVSDIYAPLLFAISDRPDMVQLLLDNRANMEIVSENGRAPLHMAIMYERTAIVQLLIDKRANLENASLGGKTPLHCAVMFRRRGIIQILLDARADVNAYDDDGYAPLHSACAKRCAPIMKLLVEYGATWNVPGYEAGEMKFLAAVWGIGGTTNINGKTVKRDGASGRKPELWVMGDALQMFVPEIAAAFNADKDLDPRKRLGKIQSGALVVLKTGYEEHAITLVFYKGYFAICNRWESKPTRVYKIDTSKVTRGLLKHINDLAFEGGATAMRFLYTELPHALRATQGKREPICLALNHGQRHLKAQKHGFCAYDSSEAALYTILALQTLRAGGNLREARVAYKFYTTHFRFYFLHEYLNQIESGRIKKEGVDVGLLLEIRDRLQNPNWQPERFTYPLFNASREITCARLVKITVACYFDKKTTVSINDLDEPERDS